MHPGVRSKVPRSRDSYEHILKNGYAAKLKLPPETKSYQQLSLPFDVRDQSLFPRPLVFPLPPRRTYPFELPKGVRLDPQSSFDQSHFHHAGSGNRKEPRQHHS
jgi:hypothetical protein